MNAPAPHRPSSHRLAPVLAVLALAASLVGAWPHDHGTSAHPGDGSAVYCPGAAHPEAPRHVEAARAFEARTCLVCVLRLHTRGYDLPAPAAGDPPHDAGLLVPRPDPRIAALGTAGPPGSRGPPPSPVVR